MRRLASVLVSTSVAAAALTTPAQAGSPERDHATDPTALQVAAKQPAQPSKKCRKRLQKVRKVVPAKRFANCVVKAMAKGSTARLSSTSSTGSSNAGVARFAKKSTDASVSYSDGAKLVVLGGKAWHKLPGRPWARARTNGTADEQLAHNIQQLWVGLSSAAAYKSYLRSSSTGWEPTGRHRKVNGVKAREYTGTVNLGGVPFDEYAVWLDRWDRPIRVKTSSTLIGLTQTTVQDFRKWGAGVSIEKPV